MICGKAGEVKMVWLQNMLLQHFPLWEEWLSDQELVWIVKGAESDLAHENYREWF